MPSINLVEANLNPFFSSDSLEVPASLDAYPAAVHEFRIPSKALLGLHSYCPVHFDVFHAVLVDLSVHIALLKAGTSTPQKVPRFVTGSVSKVDACLQEMLYIYTYISFNCHHQKISACRTWRKMLLESIMKDPIK